MPIDLTKIPTQLIDAVANGNLVPLVGAGISRQTSLENKNIFPTWHELIKDLTHLAHELGRLDDKKEAKLENLLAQEKYLVAAQALKGTLQDGEFNQFMKTRLARLSGKPGTVHRELLKLGSPLIMTTNYDLLLENACLEMFHSPATVITPKDAYKALHTLGICRAQSLPFIFKLHGTVMNPDDLVLAEKDYNRMIYLNPFYRKVLHMIFMTKYVLMLGYSFSDPDIMDIVADITTTFHMSSSNYILLPEGSKDLFERRRLSSEFGIEVIDYEPSDGYPEVLELIEHLASFVPRAIPLGAKV